MKNNIFYLYKSLYKKFGISPGSVKARDAKQQYLRFKHLISLVDIKRNDKILDVGCGLGDLSNYLKKNKIYSKYHGIDFIEEFIQAAKNTYGDKRTRFSRMDIYKDKFPSDCDWLILSGLFNDKTKNSEALMFKIIKKMFYSAKKGIVFNGLNKYVDYEDRKLFYNYPEKILKYCINNLSKYVILKTNYQLKKNTIPFEFSVAVFKK